MGMLINDECMDKIIKSQIWIPKFLSWVTEALGSCNWNAESNTDISSLGSLISVKTLSLSGNNDQPCSGRA